VDGQWDQSFFRDGFKLTDARELAIEKEIFALLAKPGAADDTAMKVAGPSLPGEAALRKAYIESLAGSVASDLSGLRVLVDCANGAATAEAPELFAKLGSAGAVCVRDAGWEEHQ
jgi:phosphoglucosamine mutase